MKSHSSFSDCRWHRVLQSLTLAVAMAGVAFLVPADGAAQGGSALPAHDTNQTSQHNALSGQVTTHDGAQTTQHNALSQQVTNVQTAVDNLSTADHSGPPPAWDMTLLANDPGGACTSNSSRFTCVLGGAAVRDNETGLVWEQSPGDTNGDTVVDTNDKLIWKLALSHCVDKNVGGRKGWRLASIEELKSLIDPTAVRPPFLPAGHPFSNLQSGFFWSASSSADFPTVAWFVNFNVGHVFTFIKTSSFFVWCVRKGESEPLARYEHLPIYKAAMDVTMYLEQVVRNFSRYYKYTLGSELRQQSRELVTLIIRANSRVDKLPVLHELRQRLEGLQVLLRMG